MDNGMKRIVLSILYEKKLFLIFFQILYML